MSQGLPDSGSAVTNTVVTELSLLASGAPAVGSRPTTMVGNAPMSLMCSNVPEVHAGPAFGSVTVPSPTVAVALVTVAAYFSISARATATATLNSPSVRDPCPGVELELLDSWGALLVQPPTAIAMSRQATAVTVDGTTLGRGGTAEWFHEKHERAGHRNAAFS